MNGKAWTPEEVKILIELYPDRQTKDIAIILNRKIASVYNKANWLDLKKSESFKQSAMSGCITKLLKKGVQYRFPKDHKPWNKGKKGIMIGGIESQFKPGSLPHNTKYDGAISLRPDKTGKKYKHIRISKGVWKLLHRVVWEKSNGPIPEGYLIRFIDGNEMNCELNNLEIISKKDNMARNTIQRFPPELVSTIKILSKLKKLTDEKQDIRP